MDIVFLVLLGLLFSFLVGRARSINKDGFKFYLSKKISFTSEKNIEFRMEVKNLSTRKKILKEEYRNMLFYVYDDSDNEIYKKSFYIPKNNYKINEYYTEYFFVDNLNKGNYSAVVKFGDKEVNKIKINFKIK